VWVEYFLCIFARRHEVHDTNTRSTQRRLIKTYKTERFTTALEAESQGYRYLLNRTFCNGVGGRTTGLQTHS